jgi:MerR family transcriptional regulator, light-induced transcriptional regulator
MPTSSSDTVFVEALRARIEAALERRDRVSAIENALGAVRDGSISVPELYVGALAPLLSQIGSAWAHGTERVWEEHFATHTVRTIVESLYLDVQRAIATIPKRGEHVLLACPPKEQHELGLRMLADRFEFAGYDVTFLGADTPLDEITAAARATGASLVALSVSTVFERVELSSFVERLREQLPGVRIVVGGPAFSLDRHWPAEDLLDTHELGLPGPPAEG